MKISELGAIGATVIAAILSLPLSFKDDSLKRPPVTPDPDPIGTPEPTPTPEPNVYRGTVGMQLPVIYDEWWLRNGDHFAILSGPSLMESAEFRTNIMMTWSGQVKFNMEFYSANGNLLGSKSYDTYSLEPCSEGSCSGYYQVNNAMTEVDPTYFGIYAVRCIPTGGTGKILFFATSIDNKSGDPTMYSQFRYAADGNVWSETGKYN